MKALYVTCNNCSEAGCNCDVTGVASLTQPCDESRTCQCRSPNFTNYANDFNKCVGVIFKYYSL